jgi:hypothetical protein
MLLVAARVQETRAALGALRLTWNQEAAQPLQKQRASEVNGQAPEGNGLQCSAAGIYLLCLGVPA